jgi:hypothetical protein
MDNGHAPPIIEAGSNTLCKRWTTFLSFNITGAASQSIAGENDLAQNLFDLAAEPGRAMFDSRHRFVSSCQWTGPSSLIGKVGSAL